MMAKKLEIEVNRNDLHLDPKMFSKGDILSFEDSSEVIYFIGKTTFVTAKYHLYDDYISVKNYSYKNGALDLNCARSRLINENDKAAKKYKNLLSRSLH